MRCLIFCTWSETLSTRNRKFENSDSPVQNETIENKQWREILVSMKKAHIRWEVTIQGIGKENRKLTWLHVFQFFKQFFGILKFVMRKIQTFSAKIKAAINHSPSRNVNFERIEKKGRDENKNSPNTQFVVEKEDDMSENIQFNSRTHNITRFEIWRCYIASAFILGFTHDANMKKNMKNRLNLNNRIYRTFSMIL